MRFRVLLCFPGRPVDQADRQTHVDMRAVILYSCQASESGVDPGIPVL